MTPKITVIGVGGAGGNAVNNMISSNLQGVEFLVCNTDAQALEGSLCENKLQMGLTVTGGLGAGAKPEVGNEAAEESLEEVMQYLEGANMAFITAGMGGGTGTGAAPVIAKACREKGILTVGVVTKPFHFEGTLRMKMAEAGIEEMQSYVDTLIVIPNQNLFRIANEKTTFAEAFRLADSVLQSGVRGVTDLMVQPGLINLDFADIRSAMLEMGKAMMGTGEADGERRAIEAAEAAINNPLLDDVTMKGAHGVIINVTGGMDMTLFEVDEACNRIRDEVDSNANIIFGSTFDEELEGIMRVSIVATGIDADERKVGLPSSGGGVVNAMTTKLATGTGKSEGGQDVATARAKPNTDFTSAFYNAESASRTGASSGSTSGQPQARGVVTTGASGSEGVARTAPSTTYQEPESELFEQHQAEATAQAAPFHAGVTEQGPAARGQVYNNAFIPPSPVEAKKPFAPTMADTPQPTETEAYDDGAATQTASRTPNQYGGLNLRPPVPGGNVTPKRKPASLFERFTNPLRGHDHVDEEGTGDTQRGSQGSASSGGMDTGLRAPQKRDTQGSLNIDAPQEKGSDKNSDDELDIPAFLRRQAN